MCGVQAAQQAPAPGFGQPELALQQQLAPQGRLQGPMQYPIQAQQLPAGGVPTQPVGGPRLGAQRQQGPAILSSSFPPGYQPAMGRCESISKGLQVSLPEGQPKCCCRCDFRMLPHFACLSFAAPGH